MKHLFSSVFYFLIIHTSIAQDTIATCAGGIIPAKVLEINPADVKYLRFDNLKGPTYTILKVDIATIKYENGIIDTFSVMQKTPDSPSAYGHKDMYDLGEKHAIMYYQGYRGAGTGTFMTSLLLSPVIGLIPAIGCSTTPPRDESLMYPKPELMKNSDYSKGYNLKAAKIKSQKVWHNWGSALVIHLIVGGIIYAIAK